MSSNIIEDLEREVRAWWRVAMRDQNGSLDLALGMLVDLSASGVDVGEDIVDAEIAIYA